MMWSWILRSPMTSDLKYKVVENLSESTLEETAVDVNKQGGRLTEKLYTYFSGKVVRMDLTKKIKEGANVPVYVLEYLLGMYCSSQNDDEIEAGVKNVKQILAENYVRPDEAQKIISKLREQGSRRWTN